MVVTAQRGKQNKDLCGSANLKKTNCVLPSTLNMDVSTFVSELERVVDRNQALRRYLLADKALRHLPRMEVSYEQLVAQPIDTMQVRCSAE